MRHGLRTFTRTSTRRLHHRPGTRAALLGLAFFLLTLAAAPASAQQPAAITGTVADPLGAPVTAATVTLVRDGQPVATTTSDAAGRFAFEAVTPGRYQLTAGAPGFQIRTLDPFFAGAGSRLAFAVNLSIGVNESLVVSASADDLPASQVGAPATVVERATLDVLPNPEVLQALRVVPGVHVLQTGARGGTTSLFVRGGAAQFNKVIVDGVGVNDIGGAFNFADLSTTDIESVEVLRSANSVVYGTDALAGIVNLTTRRGRTEVPELSVSFDGGTLGTLRQDVSIGGARGRFDYFSAFSNFTTDNDLPNNAYRASNYAGRFGWALGRATALDATIRRSASRFDSPNAVNYYGTADDLLRADAATTAVGVTADTQLSDRWRATVRFSALHQTYNSIDPEPTGEPYDPFGFGPNYLGNEVTLRAANGQTVTGRAVLNFGGTYPSTYDAVTKRQSIGGQSSYRVSDLLSVAGGLRFEHESGVTNAGTPSTTARNNVDGFLELRGSRPGLYTSGGIGLIRHDVFGGAVTPRASLAWYFRPPSSTDLVGDTKLTFNASAGIKGPSVFQELSSIYNLLPSNSNPAITPIGPERARNLDVGIEQGLWQGRARVRVGFFHNVFSDLLEYVSNTILPQLGVPEDVAADVPFGAYMNSSSYRARGVETSAEAVLGRVRFMASYTFLDAVVTESLGGDALFPAVNPAFPDVEIGAYSPLVGGRPFRRPAHSGNVLVSYDNGPARISLMTYFAGASDDSTYLSNPFFGYSMLLPNRDLTPGFQKVDIGGSYRVHRNLRWHVSLENALNKDYTAAAGFPALPRTFRTGVRVDLGGDARPRP